jgi:hypothetical protein
MTEIQEVAQGMLAAYREFLRGSEALLNTINNANAFVMLDPILKEESQARREEIARALFRMAHTEQTARDSYWTAHEKALRLQNGSRGSFAALIGDAFIRADSRNAARLIEAFPELLAD